MLRICVPRAHVGAKAVGALVLEVARQGPVFIYGYRAGGFGAIVQDRGREVFNVVQVCGIQGVNNSRLEVVWDVPIRPARRDRT